MIWLKPKKREFIEESLSSKNWIRIHSSSDKSIFIQGKYTVYITRGGIQIIQTTSEFTDVINWSVSITPKVKAKKIIKTLNALCS